MRWKTEMWINRLIDMDRLKDFAGEYIGVLVIVVLFIIFVCIVTLVAFLPVAIALLIHIYAKIPLNIVAIAVTELLWLPIGLMIDAKILDWFADRDE
jgi:hypothetical protein